jgi:protein-S-isoprenylcysteine O-methyltransferase Ste14
MVVDNIIFAAWIVFWFYWLTAAAGFQDGLRAWMRFALPRMAAVATVFLLLRLEVFTGDMVTGDPWREGIGLAVFFLGLALVIWARIYIGHSWAGPMTKKEHTTLVRTGPYSTVRHPIYSGIILAFTGAAIALSVYWLIAVAILTVFFTFSSAKEERYLSGLFPEAYPEYKRSTKRLIPFIL